MNLFLHMLAAMAVQYGTVKVNGQNYVLTSSCGGVVTEGSSCVLTCETGSVTETTIAWTRGANAPYEVAQASCTTSNPAAPSDYILACPGTSFTLNITAASVTRDKTTWICDAPFGGKDSIVIDLDVQAQDTTPTTSQTTGEMASSTSTSTTSPVSSTTDTHKTSTLSPVWIVIITVLTAVVILVIVIIIVCCASMRKKKLAKTVKSEDKDIPLKNSC